jgi:hypothetical protein
MVDCAADDAHCNGLRPMKQTPNYPASRTGPMPVRIGTAAVAASSAPSGPAGDRWYNVQIRLRKVLAAGRRWGYWFREVTTHATTGDVTDVPGGLASDGPQLSQPSSNTAYAVISSPVPGVVLVPNSSGNIAFSWAAVAGATKYRLTVGTGTGDTDVYDSGEITAPTTSATMSTSGATMDGSKWYARLYSYISSTWQQNDFVYYDPASIAHLAINVCEATNVTNGTGTQGNDVDERSASFPPSFALLPIGGPISPWVVPTGEPASEWQLPDNLAIVTVRYANSRYEFNRPNQHGGTCGNDDVAIEYDSDYAQLTSPAAGSTLTGSSETFQWSAATGSPVEYWLTIGTGIGDGTYFDASCGTSSSQAVTGLPTDGSTVWVRVWTKYDTLPYWRYNDYTVTASS